jgi:hypothetical protein
MVKWITIVYVLECESTFLFSASRYWKKYLLCFKVSILCPLVLLITVLLMILGMELWWNDAGRRKQVSGKI